MDIFNSEHRKRDLDITLWSEGTRGSYKILYKQVFGKEVMSKKKVKYVEVPIDLTDAEVGRLAREAHAKDMKLNDYIVDLIKDWIESYEIEQKIKKRGGLTATIKAKAKAKKK